jgi:hypothetical protein
MAGEASPDHHRTKEVNARMRFWGIVLFLPLAIAISSAAPSQQTVDELKARLQSMRPEDRGNIALEIAERQVVAANQLFNQGKVDEAQSAVKDVVSYAGQAGEAAGQSGHHIKNTEIALRKMAHRLADIKRTVPFDDQPSVQSAIDSLEKIRTDLLNKMFGKKEK